MANLFKTKYEMMDALIARGYDDDEVAKRMQKYVADGHGYGEESKQTGATGSLGAEIVPLSKEEEAWEKNVDKHPIMPRMAQASGIGGKLWGGVKDAAALVTKGVPAVYKGVEGAMTNGGEKGAIKAYVEGRDEALINLQKGRDFSGERGTTSAKILDFATDPSMATVLMGNPTIAMSKAVPLAKSAGMIGKLKQFVPRAGEYMGKKALEAAPSSLAGAALSDDSKDIGDVAKGAAFGMGASGALSGLVKGGAMAAKKGATVAGNLLGVTSGLDANIVRRAVDDPAYMAKLKEAAESGEAKPMKEYNDALRIIEEQKMGLKAEGEQIGQDADFAFGQGKEKLAGNTMRELAPSGVANMDATSLGARAKEIDKGMWNAVKSNNEEVYKEANTLRDMPFSPEKTILEPPMDRPPLVGYDGNLLQPPPTKKAYVTLKERFDDFPNLKVDVSPDNIWRFKGKNLSEDEIQVMKKAGAKAKEYTTIDGALTFKKDLGQMIGELEARPNGFRPDAGFREWLSEAYDAATKVELDGLRMYGAAAEPIIEQRKKLYTTQKYTQKVKDMGGYQGKSDKEIGTKINSLSPEAMDHFEKIVEVEPKAMPYLEEAQQLNFDAFLGKAEGKDGSWSPQKLADLLNTNDMQQNAVRLFGANKVDALKTAVFRFRKESDKLIREHQNSSETGKKVTGLLKAELGELGNLPKDRYAILTQNPESMIGSAFRELEGKFASDLAGVFNPKQIKDQLNRSASSTKDLQDAANAGFNVNEGTGDAVVPWFSGSNSSRGQVISRGASVGGKLIGAGAGALAIGGGTSYSQGGSTGVGTGIVSAGILASMVSPRIAKKLIERSHKLTKPSTGKAYTTGSKLAKGISRNAAMGIGARSSDDE